jgi:hypothetical protein
VELRLDALGTKLFEQVARLPIRFALNPPASPRFAVRSSTAARFTVSGRRRIGYFSASEGE